MQTVKDVTRVALRWESVGLKNGAYRIQNATVLDEAPDTERYIDCSYWNRFHDELNCVREMLSIDVKTTGLWVGMIRPGDGYMSTIGLFVEC